MKRNKGDKRSNLAYALPMATVISTTSDLLFPVLEHIRDIYNSRENDIGWRITANISPFKDGCACGTLTLPAEYRQTITTRDLSLKFGVVEGIHLIPKAGTGYSLIPKNVHNLRLTTATLETTVYELEIGTEAKFHHVATTIVMNYIVRGVIGNGDKVITSTMPWGQTPIYVSPSEKERRSEAKKIRRKNAWKREQQEVL